jgi:hypothetical protein
MLGPTVTVDSPRLESTKIEAMLRSADLWLTGKSVEGFNEADFLFLPDSERKALKDDVEAFSEVASHVPPAAPTTGQQRDAARPPFQRIIERLEFDRYLDAEAYRIGKQVERAILDRRPAELLSLRFQTSVDNTGDPAIRIWAYIKDDVMQSPEFSEKTSRIRRLLESASRAIAPERWPYVRFRTDVEQREIEEARAA